MLVQTVEDWARECGHHPVRLETGAASIGARESYSALGDDNAEVVLSKARG